tara:strand:+ start:1082 stop:1333 length:252 start_codon:yes stop_codon:yes gene_type:complete
MFYQLPSGKVIYLTIEEYLNLSDEDLRLLANSGIGDDGPSAMYYGKQKKEKIIEEETPDISLDYKPDDDETDIQGPIDINNIG